MAFTITLDSCGGSTTAPIAVSDSSITFYDILQERANPEKAGYVFAGWYDIQNSNVRTFPGLDVTYNADHTLSAWWVPESSDEYQPYVKLCQSNEGQPGVTSVTYGNTNMYTDGPFSAPVMQYLLWGKTINYIKIMMGWWAGKLSIVVFPKAAIQAGATGIQPLRTLELTTHANGNRTPEIYEFDDFTINQDEVLALVLPTDGNGSRFFICDGVNVSGNATRTFDGPLYRNVGNGTTTYVWNGLNVDIGYKSALPPSPVTGVTVDKAAMTVNQHSSGTVVATVLPAGAVNKNVTWQASNSSIAITANALTCTVTGAEQGDAVLSVITEDGGFVATTSVHVDPPLPLFTFTFKDSADSSTIAAKSYYEATTLIQIYKDFYDEHNGNPVKDGYMFGGWFGQQNCTWTMQVVQGNGTPAVVSTNQTYYAKWNPVQNDISTFIDGYGRGPTAVHSIPWYGSFPLCPGLYPAVWGRKINYAKFKVGNPGPVCFNVYEFSALSSIQNPVQQFSCDLGQLGYQHGDVVELDFYNEISVGAGQMLAVGPQQDSSHGQDYGPIMVAESQTTGDALLDGSIITRIGSGNPQLLQKNENVTFAYKDNGGIHVTGISVSPLTASMTVDEKTVLTATVEPPNAGNKDVHWEIVSGSSNVSISADDGICEVTGTAAGHAVVKVYSDEDASISALAELTVIPETAYHVTFDSNGGSAVDSIEFTKSTSTFSLPVPSKAGFHFVGWFEDLTLLIGDILTAVQTGTQRDIAVKAKWVSQNLYDHFCGKTFSFMGDSMTTFWTHDAPHNPNTIYTQYVCSQNGITEQTTYWGQILQALNGQLGTLNAIGTTGVISLKSNAETQMVNYQHRLNDLAYNGTPDVIYVFAGTNDVGGGSDGGASVADIADFDPAASYVSGPLDTTTTDFGTDITRAYVVMLRRIQQLYPSAEIVCMNPWKVSGSSESSGRNPALIKLGTVVEDICEFFGIYYVNLMDSSMYSSTGDTTVDALHPNNKGFTLIADYALNALAEQTAEVVHVSEITLDTHELSIGIAETAEIAAAILPDNATNKNVWWQASNDKISFEYDKLQCSLTADTVGSTRLSAVTYDGKLFDVCEVTISSEQTMYLITWKDSLNPSWSAETAVEEGTMPSYIPPVHAGYDFVSWQPAVHAANADAEYTAQYAVHPAPVTSEYEHMLHNGKKIQVDSAIRDGSGRKIETKYIRTINHLPPADGDVTIPLSDYYQKTETSSALEIRTEFEDLTAVYAKKAETSSAAEIEAGIYELSLNLSTDVSSLIIQHAADADILSTAIDSKIYVEDPSTGLSAKTDLSVIKTTQAEFIAVIGDGSADLSGNVLYIVSSDSENMFGQRVTNVGAPEEDADAATKQYVDAASYAIVDVIPVSVSQLTNDAGYLTEHQSLTALSSAIDAKIYSGNISADEDDEEGMIIDMSQTSSLSVIKIDPQVYGHMLSNDAHDMKTIYEISWDDEIVAYGQRITYLADGESDTDGATVGQVKSLLNEAVGDINTILEALN